MDTIGGDRVAVPRNVTVFSKCVPVISLKPICGPDPDESKRVAYDPRGNDLPSSRELLKMEDGEELFLGMQRVDEREEG